MKRQEEGKIIIGENGSREWCHPLNAAAGAAAAAAAAAIVGQTGGGKPGG